MVYLIKYLHQITAENICNQTSEGYILSSIYIKSQHLGEQEILNKGISYQVFTSNHSEEHGWIIGILGISYQVFTSNHSVLMLLGGSVWVYLIKYLHQITAREITLADAIGYILSSIYIKSQQTSRITSSWARYILSSIYIKSQQKNSLKIWLFRYILSSIYIKSQHQRFIIFGNVGISYQVFTSNHSCRYAGVNIIPGISYQVFTSNHSQAFPVPLAFFGISYQVFTSNHSARVLNCLHPTGISYQVFTSNHS